jgi:hypothetical protein
LKRRTPASCSWKPTWPRLRAATSSPSPRA